MYLIQARNVNDALPQGYRLLQRAGITRDSRYGIVTELDEPVTTHYEAPLERVLFSPERDANPFLHLFESLWILAGRSDVAFLEQFAKGMREFSDDGTRYHAAYGHRLRRHFDTTTMMETGIGMMPERRSLDQLKVAAQMLRADPGSRRVVCSIWDPMADLNTSSKDIPCNDMIKFEARSGKLNMIVFNRSNDLVWGTYGANAVQFAFILEYVAAMARLPVGWYEQISSNFHMYAATQDKARGAVVNAYRQVDLRPYALMADPDSFDSELRDFLAWCDHFHQHDSKEPPRYRNHFLTDVAGPLFCAHRAYKAKHWHKALRHVEQCGASDWRYTAMAWLSRREK